MHMWSWCGCQFVYFLKDEIFIQWQVLNLYWGVARLVQIIWKLGQVVRNSRKCVIFFFFIKNWNCIHWFKQYFIHFWGTYKPWTVVKYVAYPSNCSSSRVKYTVLYLKHILTRDPVYILSPSVLKGCEHSWIYWAFITFVVMKWEVACMIGTGDR